MAKPLIIVGTGLAGYNLAREWRKLDPDSPLVMITQDDGAFYSKPMLSNALAKNKTPEALPMASAEKMMADLQAVIHTGTRVTALDPAQQQLTLSTGETLAYAQLVLALGASALIFPMQGDAADQVYTVNDLASYARFRQAISGKRHVSILGPGLIGCEFANDLLHTGYAVSVIGPAAQPLDQLLPEAASKAVKAALTEEGVDWHLQTVCRAIENHEGRLRLRLENGTQLDTDVVLSAVGLRPNTELALAAGLEVNRGIQVDRYLQTRQANIYALGDCAEVAGLVLPYVLPLMSSARALAKTLSGEPTAVSYPAMPVVVKVPAHPVVVSPPPVGQAGDWRIESSDEGVMACFYSEDERLLGFALTGQRVSEKPRLAKLLPAVLP
ncbi:MAG: FAD-dependent oxidoreductase [Gammaproteobacteria bacterium]